MPEKPLEVDVMTEKRDFPAPTIIGARQGALLSPGEVKFVTDNFSCFQFFVKIIVLLLYSNLDSKGESFHLLCASRVHQAIIESHNFLSLP